MVPVLEPVMVPVLEAVAPLREPVIVPAKTTVMLAKIIVEIISVRCRYLIVSLLVNEYLLGCHGDGKYTSQRLSHPTIS